MNLASTTSVLVVDDEVSIREVLADLLKESGYRVLTATNGAEALRMIERDPPDLVLTDVMMPVMDGHELLLHLRDDPGLEGLAIVVMSAAQRLQLADGVHVAAVLSKPFDFDLLLHIVRHALAQRYASDD
jgi:CheY-like chemotaxis protein